jgi:hypothetical protein
MYSFFITSSNALRVREHADREVSHDVGVLLQ